jgi:hypothetical protein
MWLQADRRTQTTFAVHELRDLPLHVTLRAPDPCNRQTADAARGKLVQGRHGTTDLLSVVRQMLWNTTRAIE